MRRYFYALYFDNIDHFINFTIAFYYIEYTNEFFKKDQHQRCYHDTQPLL